MTPNPPSPVGVQGRLDPDLSRGLWLVKWLLLVPHLFVLAFLWLAFWVLTIVAFFAILFTGRYPGGIFDFVVGMDRWVLRVTADAALMTDAYPPFRLDQGGFEPVPVPADTGSEAVTGSAAVPAGAPVATGTSPRPSPGHAVIVTAGSLLAVFAATLAGLTGLVTDTSARDGVGFRASDTRILASLGYAVRSGPLVLSGGRADPTAPATFPGDVGIRARSVGEGPVLAGIAPAAEATG
ncbi:DUF4389 domain-containing protein [Pseudonocardia sp. H11422]|uniref:DUF4389 domain-containing protein n=1 Tax=Pseudonocardia sp. H11422 TaxID=2835866 RepID=UPI001BDC5B70|nr:DUF4389 domain-containing protein [Pseudonocardia sp. H11422]